MYNKSRLAENFHLVDEYSSLQRNQFFLNSNDSILENFLDTCGEYAFPLLHRSSFRFKNSSLAMRTFCVFVWSYVQQKRVLFRFFGLFHVVLFVSRGKKLMQLKFHLELQFVDFCTLMICRWGSTLMFSIYLY